MQIAVTEHFQRDAAGPADDRRTALFEAMLPWQGAIGKPYLHQRLGIRKWHASGIWQARVGLGLRLIFALAPARMTLVRIGSHDEVRRYLREL